MMRWFCLSALLLGLAAATSRADGPTTPAAAVKPGDATYYPTKIGTTWTYKFGDKKLITRVARTEKKGKYDCAVVETLVDGAVVATEHVAVVPGDGVYRVAYNGQEPKEPIKILKLPPKKGDTWDVKTEVAGETIEGKFTVGEEEITVPISKDKLKTFTSAGDFKFNGQDFRFHYWFHDKYGAAKIQLTLNGQDITLELEKFEEGK